MNDFNIPRPEYPRPQMKRIEWINLNGIWEFEIDHGKSGIERRLYEADSLSMKINVPFCPESKLSGIEHKDFMDAVWYRREFVVPNEYKGKRILLHFGAVDYEAHVWINSKFAGRHKGGYTSFSFDITDYANPGENIIHVCAIDDVRSGNQARGKQSEQYYSNGCDYTRTTGIWQTVWLEFVPQEYIESFLINPDPENKSLHIQTKIYKPSGNTRLKVTAKYEGEVAGEKTVNISGESISLSLDIETIHLWEPLDAKLYDLYLEIINVNDDDDEVIIEKVESYFGMRQIKISDKAVLINGKSVFQRLILDQGFYPDGIYTAPSEIELVRDIQMSLDMGFNGARLHQKIFEPLFLYHADKMGYLVWGEYQNWGLDITGQDGLMNMLPQWQESVLRDYNHPSIVGWCPFNETWDRNGVRQNDDILEAVYYATKALDPTRPVIDTSGNFHVITDIFDIHDYEQNPEEFAKKFEEMKSGGEVYVTYPDRQKYEGQPYFVSEYGGIRWNPETDEGWGYGNAPKTEEEFIGRYRGLTSTLLENPNIFAFCYTQLTDVEQEVNGLYTYDRKPKFDPEIIKEINQARAEIEK